MSVAIGVHGRFSAFNIAIGLIALGEDVHLFTNYPPRVVERFGVPARLTRGFVAHGVAMRIAGVLLPGGSETVESMMHRSFGAWFARQIKSGQFDVVHAWSGVAEEAFRITRSRKILNRSSVHIQVQRDLLADESRRVGHPIDMPSAWRIEREKREYALADVIIVPSLSAQASFEGTPDAQRVACIPLTADALWRPVPDVIDERIRRINSRQRLRVLFVGALSYRKGLLDIARVVENMSSVMDFRFTGVILPECRNLVSRLGSRARFDGHVPEAQLSESYSWADILICPSIEDGFGVVLSHAQAAGIPFIASTNTGGPDLLAMGGKGWIVPIRSPDAIEAQLSWCDTNRPELAAMVSDLYAHPVARSWVDVAREVVACFYGQRMAE